MLSKKASYVRILQEFFEVLSIFHIQISEEYYLLLKRDCSILKKLLHYFALEDVPFADLEKTFKQNLFYVSIKPSQISLQVTMDVFFRYYQLLDDTQKNKLLKGIQNKNTLLIHKIKFLIDNDQDFQNIYAIFCKVIHQVSLDEFRKILFSLDEQRLHYLIEQYRYNLVFTLDSLKQYDYLYFLANVSPKMDIPIEENEADNICSLPTNYQCFAKENLPRKRKYHSLYDFFTLVKPELTDEDKKVIQILFQ